MTKRVFFALIALNLALAGAVYARSTNVETQQRAWCCLGGQCTQASGWQCMFAPTCGGPEDCEEL